jgi:hypothetical protein
MGVVAGMEMVLEDALGGEPGFAFLPTRAHFRAGT